MGQQATESISGSRPGRQPADLAALLLALFLGLVVLGLALLLLSPLAPVAPEAKPTDNALLADPAELHPEPGERFLYVAGVLLLPFCLGGAYLAVRRFRGTVRGRRLVEQLATPTAWLLAPLGVALFFAAGFSERSFDARHFIPGGWGAFAAAVALALGITSLRAGRFRERTRRVLRWLLPGLSGLLFLGILLFNILGPEHVRNSGVFHFSFNAFFHSVVQVYFGRQLLVDFPNQYGLYPHFLDPVLHLVGLSMYSFTALMGILNCLAFWCFARVLAKESGDALLAFLGLTTLVFTGYVAGRVLEQDLYLQFHPLRILFPAFALVAARAYAHAPSRRLDALLFALGAAAFLWNPETGFVVFASGFLLVCYDALLRRRALELPVRLLLGLAAAAAVIASFSVLMRLRFGAFPDYTRLFLYPRAFFLYGVGMIPMPRFGLWVVVLALYATGLLLSLKALVEGEDTPRARLRFYLAVLGLGMFTYYQGRSVLGNLAAAGYPAVILGVLFADDLRRQGLPRPPAAERVFSVAVLALLLHSVAALATVAPAWVGFIAEKVRVSRSGEEHEVLKDARFLRYYVRPGDKVLISSKNSAFYHLMTQTTSPLAIPGSTELVYFRDINAQSAYMASRSGPFVLDRLNLKPAQIQKLCGMYSPNYDNPFGSLIVFPAPRRN